MVPYIRKSFLKHFIDGLKYIEGFSEEDIKKFEDELKNVDYFLQDDNQNKNDNDILSHKESNTEIIDTKD